MRQLITFTILIFFFIILLLYGCRPAVNKIAFHPDKKNILSKNRFSKNIKDIFFTTEDKVKIQAYFIPDKKSKKILIYFHGNAGNISHRLYDLIKIRNFGINVLGVSYRGYGKSQGEVSEAGIYLDGKAAINHTIKKLGFSMKNIIILGRSIGTTVAIDISQNLNIGGLILVTPLTSGKKMAKSMGISFLSFLAGDAFNNIKKLENILCPVMVIHGTEDNIIPINMGREIFNKIKSKKTFIKITGAGHNNLSTSYRTAYWPPIKTFISELTLESNNQK